MYSISNVNNIYDIFITGSDQVWNYKITANDKNYFLDFCHDDSKKIVMLLVLEILIILTKI